MYWYDGQSGGVTPGPIPNPAVKPARVPVCTVLRKRTGTQARCQPLFHSYLVAERLFRFSRLFKSLSSINLQSPVSDSVTNGRACFRPSDNTCK